MAASNAPATSSISPVGTGNGVPVSIVSANASIRTRKRVGCRKLSGHRLLPDRRDGDRGFAARLGPAAGPKDMNAPEHRPGTHRRHMPGRAAFELQRRRRRHRADPAAACGKQICASTVAIGPARLISASITCSPAPVKPPPGDTSGSSRHPPVTRVECSLVKWPSICRTSPSAPVATRRFSSCIAGKQRLLLPSANGTPAFAQAGSRARPRARVSASGFSHQTGLPAAAAASKLLDMQRMRRGQKHRLRSRGIGERLVKSVERSSRWPRRNRRAASGLLARRRARNAGA